MLAIAALGVAVAYIIVIRRRVPSARELPLVTSDITLPTCPTAPPCPEPEPTPPPSAMGKVPICIGCGVNKTVVLPNVEVWPVDMAGGPSPSRHETYDIMKRLFIKQTGFAGSPDSLFCIVDNKKKDFNSVVSEDPDITPGTVIWMYPKKVWVAKARSPG